MRNFLLNGSILFILSRLLTSNYKTKNTTKSGYPSAIEALGAGKSPLRGDYAGKWPSGFLSPFQFPSDIHRENPDTEYLNPSAYEIP